MHKGRRATSSTSNAKRAAIAPRVSGRSRAEIRDNKDDPYVMAPTGGAVAVEELARAAQALLVKRISGETVARARKLFDQQLWLWG